MGAADPAGLDIEDRSRSRSSATTTAAGESSAGTESLTHEFIVTSRPRHSLLVSRYSTRPEARANVRSAPTL